MSSEVSAARTRLYDALTANGGLPAWRVWRTTPAQIAAPSIFIDSVELGLDELEGASFVAAVFPVVVVADGTVRTQIEALDDALAYVWDASRAAGGEPTDSQPVALDVGGPTLRAHVLRVGMILTARTLCPSTLVTTGGTP
jgi:hypothetical protein